MGVYCHFNGGSGGGVGDGGGGCGGGNRFVNSN
jgi:hypothetical protein